MKIDIQKKYDVLLGGKASNKSIKDILSQNERTLIYFYPKDNTPGCTMESKDFTCLKGQFGALGIQIVGVSKDDMASHSHFMSSESLDVDLISDVEGHLHDQFGVIGEKNLYGKKSIGVIRSTFLLDQKGEILQEWRNVKATGHAEMILKKL